MDPLGAELQADRKMTSGQLLKKLVVKAGSFGIFRRQCTVLVRG